MELEKIRETFRADRFAAEMGAEILEAKPGRARCALTLAPGHRNAAGGVMGGVIFTLADFAFAVAANCREMGTVSLASQITYLSRAKGERLFALASCVRTGRSTCYYVIDVTDELGIQVAQVTTTGFIANK